MDAREPHEVLGVDEDASGEEIRQAYRSKVKQYHPDVSDAADAETRFRRIHEAYNSMMSEGDGVTRSAEVTQGREDTGRGRTDRNRRSETDRRGAEDRFKTMEEYDEGWRLAVCRRGEHMGEWVVYRHTGPRTDEVRYLTRGGESTDEAVHFGTRRQAEMCYENYAKRTGHGPRRPGSGPGRDQPGRKRANHRVGQNTTREQGGSETVQGEKVGGFDSLWSLYRDASNGDERWAVVSELSGSPYYLSQKGKQQRDGFWFGSKAEAERAYKAYMAGASDRGKGSRNLTGDSDHRGSHGPKQYAAVDTDAEGEDIRPPVSALGAVLEGTDALTRRTVLGAGLLFVVLVIVLLISGVL
ncbi:MAG: J domain-containing protein [Halobacteriales archaeon]